MERHEDAVRSCTRQDHPTVFVLDLDPPSTLDCYSTRICALVTGVSHGRKRLALRSLIETV